MSSTYPLTMMLVLSVTAAIPVVNAQEVETPAMSSESRIIELPHSAGSGSGKEVDVLLDQSHLKLATIALREGTVLPPHSAPVPATIVVLEGEGVTHIGGKAVPLSKGTLVSLAAGEEHDVVPKAESDMLLLVHYLRGAGDRSSP